MKRASSDIDIHDFGWVLLCCCVTAFPVFAVALGTGLIFPESKDIPMKLDTHKLIQQCDDEIQKAREDGFKAGYLDSMDVSPYRCGDLFQAWREGYALGEEARIARHQQKGAKP